MASEQVPPTTINAITGGVSKAYAVRPGGTLHILEVGLEDTRLGPESGLWFDFLSISFYEHGHAHTESEYRAWLEQAGFGEVEVRWGPPGPDLAIIGRRLG